MSKTSLLVLALAGLVVLATLVGRCSCEDHGRRELLADGCQQIGTLRPTNQSHSCDECCEVGQAYPTYECSPPVTGSTTRATMTLNDFEERGDGGDPSECDGKFHNNSQLVVALSTGWFAGGKRCGKNIRINAKGGSVLARVVDQCDSLHGCDRPHAYQPPCRPNIVDASRAVWDALGITGDDDVGEFPVTWSDTTMLEGSGTGTRLHALCRIVTAVIVAVLCASSM